MPTETYSREMIDKMNENVMLQLTNMERLFMAKLETIDLGLKAQAKAEEGNDVRVDSLEEWRAYLTGAVAIIAIIVLPLLGYIFQAQLSNLKDQIKNSVGIVTTATAAAK